MLIVNFINPNVLRIDHNSHAVAVIPYIVRVYNQIMPLVRTDRQLVVVAFVQDKMHFAA